MILRWGLCLAILGAPLIRAGTIDISNETSTVVRTGETLVFQLLTGSFGVNAARYGRSAQVTDVYFAFASALPGELGDFAATLESADRTEAVGFDSLHFGPGHFQSIGYDGAVATLEGFLHVAPLVSKALFGGSSVVIALRNGGPDVTVGLAPYLLRQDLYASLSGSSISVGAMPLSVELESQENRFSLMNFGASSSFAADSEVPEPRTGVLFLGTGAVLCGLSLVLRRLTRGRMGRYRAKNQPFASANPL